MPIPADFKERRKASKQLRAEKASRLRKWLPLLEVLCRKYGITLREIPNGYQFRLREYILNWWLSTNKIIVQYPGCDDAKEFHADGEPGEPKIMKALKKLIGVTWPTATGSS